MNKHNLRRFRPPMGYLVVLFLAIACSPTPTMAAEEEAVTWETIEADSVEFSALQGEILSFVQLATSIAMDKFLTPTEREFFLTLIGKYESDEEGALTLQKALANSDAERPLAEEDLPHVWQFLKGINNSHKAFLDRYNDNLIRFLAALNLTTGSTDKILEATGQRIRVVEKQQKAWVGFEKACFRMTKVRRYLAEATQ